MSTYIISHPSKTTKSLKPTYAMTPFTEPYFTRNSCVFTELKAAGVFVLS